MEQILFQNSMEGLEMERVVRDYEYSMVTRHFHATCELYYLVEGERYYFIDKQTYRIRAGDAVLIRPNQIHKTSMASESYHSRILLQIAESILDPVLRASGLGEMGQVFAGEAVIVSVPEEERPAVMELFAQIGRELQGRQRQYEAAVKLKLAELLLVLSRFQKRSVFEEEKQEVVQTWKHQKVHEVADYLLTHPETGESLEEVARRFYVSKSYLSRIFKEVTSFTVNEYKIISRIKKSQQLLADSSCSVTEISEMLGFENMTSYERVFKKYVGMTPLKYRRQQQAS